VIKIYEKPGHVVTSYNARLNYVLLKWADFQLTLDEIKALHVATLDTARKYKCFHYIADTARVANAFPQDVIRWWGEIWVPQLVAYGLKAIITIVPSKAMAQLSTKRWQGYVVGEIAQANVASLAEAEALLSES
jgi:hypothetical protein